MFSGIKFISRDKLLSSSEKGNDSGLDGFEVKKKQYSSTTRKTKLKKNNNQDDSDTAAELDDGKMISQMGKREKSRKRNNKRRKKRDNSSFTSDDNSLRTSSSESFNSEDDSKIKRNDRRRRKRNKESSDDYSSFSDQYEKKRSKKRKQHKLQKSRDAKNIQKDTSSEDDDELHQDKKELARKELGLDWMLRPANRMVENNRASMMEDTEGSDALEIQRVNPREMNPYLKDNGSGFPDDASISEASDKLLSSSVVGDGGASWRLKALKRAKEQAEREGRKLDEVVEERWGSLGRLTASVAGCRAAPVHAHLHAIRDRRKGEIELPEEVPSDETKQGIQEVHRGGRDYLHNISSRNPEMRKPRHDDLSWKRSRSRNMSVEDKSLISAAISGINKFSNDGSFMDNIAHIQSKDQDVSNRSSQPSQKNNEDTEKVSESSKHRASDEILHKKQDLSANHLAAKVLQLRMKGRHEEAEKLTKEMEVKVGQKDAVDAKTVRVETRENTSRYMRKQISSEHKGREEDADFHLAKTIIQNKQYSMAEDDEYGFDVAPSRKRNKKKEEVPEGRGISTRLLTQQERCQFCFENPSRPKHLVASIANFTYLMLPQWQPVVAGHCCILTMQHEAATRSVDKNVWEEIRNFKKCLLKMFASHDKFVLFLETAIGLAKQRRHCLIECVPIPYELAEQAPMYFRKAIEEAEEEWGQHDMKKVIPTSGNLRNVIPENFSYFHVEFGLDKGFVHVIDKDSNFNSGFGLNVIRGLLRLPEEDMYRRRKHEPMETQKQAVASFARDWEPFDWTRQLG